MQKTGNVLMQIFFSVGFNPFIVCIICLARMLYCDSIAVDEETMSCLRSHFTILHLHSYHTITNITKLYKYLVFY